MSEENLVEITRKELSTLKDFLVVLKDERDAIISFSLEGIIRENSRKENLLRSLEDLESQREAFLEDHPDSQDIAGSKELMFLRSDIRITMGEVKTALDKNMHLLSFSMDHVQSSIENIVRFLNRTAYGAAKKGRISLMLSREI